MQKIIFLFLTSVFVLTADVISGLWLINIEVDKVNELFSGTSNANNPQDTSYSFDLQMVVHCDENGNTKLLKEVFVMQTIDDDNKTRVLVIDETEVMNYEGIVRRGDNRLVPIRFVTPSFDFDGKYVDLTGSIQNANVTISGEVFQGESHPTNPFRHQFHPSHKVGRDITRNFTIEIEENTESNQIDKLDAVYSETIQGIHKADVKVSGKAQLIFISPISYLIGN